MVDVLKADIICRFKRKNGESSIYELEVSAGDIKHAMEYEVYYLSDAFNLIRKVLRYVFGVELDVREVNGIPYITYGSKVVLHFFDAYSRVSDRVSLTWYANPRVPDDMSDTVKLIAELTKTTIERLEKEGIGEKRYVMEHATNAVISDGLLEMLKVRESKEEDVEVDVDSDESEESEDNE